MIKLVLFDLDGVLCSAVRLHYKAFMSALYCVSGTLLTEQEHTERFNGLPSLKKLDMLLAEGRVSYKDIEKINRIKQEFTVALIKEYIDFDPTKVEIFKYLKEQKIETGCVTNCSNKTALLMLDNIGVVGYLDFWLTNEDIKPKPDPDGYFLGMSICKTKSLMRNEVLIVEDSPIGLQAANLTGANVWAVSGPEEVTLENLKKLL